jgi:hypothetical protein
MNIYFKNKNFLLFFFLFFSGCAGIENSPENRTNNTKTTNIKILDEFTNSPLNGITCDVISSKNRYIINLNQPITQIPSNTLNIREDYMTIKCKKEGYHSIQKVVRATSSDNKQLLKNSAFSGLLGALTGSMIYMPTALVLPENIIIKMKKL